MPPLRAQQCWYLTGPTASGKTSVGIALARRIGAEIVSMDSMALYRGMDIGTAKPSPEQRGAVPHHLLDILDADEEYSLAQYLEAAQAEIDAITARSKAVLFVGGTPLYLKGLLRGVFEGPPADWPLRHALEQEARDQGPGYLHQKLAEVDPEAAGRLHANDTRRLIRALEVHRKTGRPISAWQRQFAEGLPAEAAKVFVLDWPREELDARIDRRVERMFADGLVDETRALVQAGRRLSRTAAQALGYREVFQHLSGEHSLEETVGLVQIHTRQFAKRQRTWFRSLSECRRVAVQGAFVAESMAERIAEAGQAR